MGACAPVRRRFGEVGAPGYDSCSYSQGDGRILRFCSKTSGAFAAAVAFLALQGTAALAKKEVEAPLSEWAGVSRVVAVGDLHGSYEKALKLFQGAGLIDADHKWIGGEQHLVTAGDLLDRGEGDRPLMDLMMRLQREAEAAGGMVHVLLGNHESMNLLRDLRYVNPRSFAAWADEETDADRKRAWRDYSNSRQGSDRKSKVISDFQSEFPPGFFARQRSLDQDGEYGKWLLTLPAVVKINGVIYVHGGLTVETAALGLDELNRSVLQDLDRHLAAREVLVSEGLVKPIMDYAQILRVAKTGLNQPPGRVPPQLFKAAQEIVETAQGPYLSTGGPLWYRGAAFEDERIEREMLDRSLELLGARAMVVAHSPTTNKRITSRFHGKLFKVDHNIGQSEKLQALVDDAEEIVVIEANTQLTLKPVEELPIGNHLPRDPAVLSDRDLRELLAEGEILNWRFLGRGTTRPRLLELKKNGYSQRGIFKSVEKVGDDGVTPIDRYQHEMAAYRLDRAIGLDMVPVTVLRNVDGLDGSLQEWVEGAVDREAAEAYELRLFDSEGARLQLSRGAVFDLLIGNPDRKPGDILSLVRGDKLYLIDHSKAFSVSTDVEWQVGQAESVDAEFLQAIGKLDRSLLIQELSELISEAQIDALLARRDKILDQAVATASEPGSESSKVSAAESGQP